MLAIVPAAAAAQLLHAERGGAHRAAGAAGAADLCTAQRGGREDGLLHHRAAGLRCLPLLRQGRDAGHLHVGEETVKNDTITF